MISGNISLLSITINFHIDSDNIAHVVVFDAVEDLCESYIAEGDNFMKALAIAVHDTGQPDFSLDYDNAEKAQPVTPELRFIPGRPDH